MRVAVAVALLLLGATLPLSAQPAAQILDEGIAAYRRLQLDSAASLFVALLERSDIPEAVREQALAFLGAIEFARGRRAEAARSFRDLVLLAPKHRMDSLTFTQDVRRAYDGVRETTKAVALDVPAATVLRPGGDPFTVTATPSSPHLIRAVLLSPAGAPLQTLYEGPLNEPRAITWHGQVGEGTRADSGRYTLVITSSAEPGAVLRHLRLPLEVRREPVDTLPTPPGPDSAAFLPERRKGGVWPLAAGLGAGAATVLLPTLLGTDAAAGPARFAVGGAISLIGIIGFVTGRRGEPLPANVAANQAIQQAWQREADRVAAVNRERRATPSLLVRAGSLERREGDWR